MTAPSESFTIPESVAVGVCACVIIMAHTSNRQRIGAIFRIERTSETDQGNWPRRDCELDRWILTGKGKLDRVECYRRVGTNVIHRSVENFLGLFMGLRFLCRVRGAHGPSIGGEKFQPRDAGQIYSLGIPLGVPTII